MSDEKEACKSLCPASKIGGEFVNGWYKFFTPIKEDFWRISYQLILVSNILHVEHPWMNAYFFGFISTLEVNNLSVGIIKAF